jgi:putative transposase
MAKQVVPQRCVPVRVECLVFGISESRYRYKAKLNTEGEEIADGLLRITGCHRNWGAADVPPDSVAPGFRVRELM